MCIHKDVPVVNAHFEPNPELARDYVSSHHTGLNILTPLV